MANCHSIFLDFNELIRLHQSKRKSLRASRREIRRKIKKFFDENKKNEIRPKFHGQGSWEMDTIINPIPREENLNGSVVTLLYYDIDDGIYFIGNENPGDRKSIQTYHDWIYEAVKGHTSKDPIDKNACVRVIFADGHNIDLPIYYKQGDTPELAHKIRDWIDSDPKKFTEWFNTKADLNEQLRRVVRYLKAWKDYREFCRNTSFPSGLVLTILAATYFHASDRDDLSLKETLIKIEAALSAQFVCNRPTVPERENLLAKYGNKDYFLEQLRNFISDAKKALEEKNQNKSCGLWQKHLGDRLPCHLAEDKNESSSSIGLATIIPATIKPFCK
ncbi:MAG: cyclic GMP-AMP synthase DncV-like nucleotidyltransferase [Bacteroidota bacterium]